MTAIYAPPPPTAAQLDMSYQMGLWVANRFWPVVDFDALFAENEAGRARCDGSAVLERYFDGVADCLEAMRQVQRVEVTA